MINLNSSQQLSTLFFGGLIKNNVRRPMIDSQGLPVYIKTGINKGEIKFVNDIIELKLDGLIRPLSEWKNSKGYSTSEEVLRQISLGDKDHIAVRIANKLLELRKISKELNTYYLGLSALIDENNLIHAQFSHCGYGDKNEESIGGTETGRLSCSKPNLQQVPKSSDSVVRQHFISRFQNGTLLEGDLSQIEIVGQAQLSQDRQFMQDVMNGVDFHLKRLAFKEKLSYEEVYNQYKGKDKGIAERRSKIKEFSFMMSYGAFPKAIAHKTGLSIEEIKEMMKNEEIMYPTLSMYNTALKDFINKTQKTTDRFTKKGHRISEGWYTNPLGSRYSMFTEDTPDWMDQKTQFSTPKIKNYIIQGICADIILILLGRVFREALKHRDKFLLVNTVHDSILIDCKEEHKDFACNMIQNQVNLLIETFKTDFDYIWQLPIKIEFKSGRSWYDCI